MPTQILMSRIRNYQTARDRLVEARDAEFKPGRAVRVLHDRYRGCGLIVFDANCPLHALPVRLENGNTHWYPMEDCSLAPRDSCPPWLKRLIKVESKSAVRRLAAQR